MSSSSPPSAISSPSSSSDSPLDPTPFLTASSTPTPPSPSPVRSLRRHSLREAARFLRRASSRHRNMREPSVAVRETASEQLEERQSDWAYSRPVVVLDMIWNLAFVVATSVVLWISRKEDPSVPLRVWVVGYGVQCLIHMICVFVEFRKRRRGGGRREEEERERLVDDGEEAEAEEDGRGSSLAKHMESANTMFSFIWWIIGFYWVSAGGQSLAQSSPLLYWLCIVFLAFDVFFVIFCVALACVIGIAVCCCLPCIIALLYAVADQEGASKEDIEQLTKYKFRRNRDVEKEDGEIQGSIGGIMTECGTDSPTEHVLSPENAECCICLSSYEDGVELRELPCSHHFHCTCVDKWLHINATCPLCKYNILKSSNNDREEV